MKWSVSENDTLITYAQTYKYILIQNRQAI